MKQNLIGLILLLLLTNCTTTNSSTEGARAAKSNKNTLPKIQYYADLNNNGTYELIDLEADKKPAPNQGQNQWVRDFYGAIKYPAMARENGISGIVMLNVNVDKLGKVANVEVKKGISKACDEEAKRAFIASTKQGYKPLTLQNKTVNFRMELPVGFWLN